MWSLTFLPKSIRFSWMRGIPPQPPWRLKARQAPARACEAETEVETEAVPSEARRVDDITAF